MSSASTQAYASKESVPREFAVIHDTTDGINTGGIVNRIDDIAIPLCPAFPSPHPSDFDVITAIETRVKKLMGVTA